MEVLEIVEKPAKKTYNKHKTEKKIGINFYLNQKLKPSIVYGKECFSIYCRISYNGTDTKVKVESLYVASIEEFQNKNSPIHVNIEENRIKKQKCFNQILNYNKNEEYKIINATQLYEAYQLIYETDFTDSVYDYLISQIASLFITSQLLDHCKKNVIDFKKLTDKQIFAEMGFVFKPLITSYSKGSNPSISLDIVAEYYPFIKEFLIKKIPSKIWILKDLIFFNNSMSLEYPSFRLNLNDTPFTWYDFETGLFEEFLYPNQTKIFLSKDDVKCIMHDLSKLRYLSLSGNSDFLSSLIDKEFIKFME